MIKVDIINKSKNPLPIYAKKGDSGFDLMADFSAILKSSDIVAFNSYASWKEDKLEKVTIRPGGRVIIPVNIFTAIPIGYEVQVRPRSGLAIKKGITVLNTPGTIDSGYRNGWGVILINMGIENFDVHQGDKIAQGVLVKVEEVEWNEVTELSESERNMGGFGHTGVSTEYSTEPDKKEETEESKNESSPNLTADEILSEEKPSRRRHR